MHRISTEGPQHPNSSDSEIRHDGRAIMAYKGGHYERDLLAKLGISALNLENFHCPKAKVLMNQLIWLETCGNHTVPDAYAHCAKLEVEAYAYWLEKTMNFIEQYFSNERSNISVRMFLNNIFSNA